jgi:hypothetical protein
VGCFVLPAHVYISTSIYGTIFAALFFSYTTTPHMHSIFKYLGFVCCLSLSHMALAQDSTMIYPKHQLKFNPLKALGLVNPGIEFGYERRIGNRFAAHVAATYLCNPFNLAPYQAYSGYRLIAEQKYIVPIQSLSIWFYPSISFVYNTMNINSVGGFADTGLYNIPGASQYYGYDDSFKVTKRTYSVNACAGLVVPIHRFLIDISAGLGVKYRDVTHSGRINPNDKMIPPRHPNVYYAATNEGQYFTPNLLLTIRIAYSF